MKIFIFEDFWDALHTTYQNGLSKIAEYLSWDKFNSEDWDEPWGGKLFWDFIYEYEKTPVQRKKFRDNIDELTSVKFLTLKSVRKQGLAPLNSKIAFCYSAFIHEESFGTSFHQFFLKFYKYLEPHPSHLDLDILKSALNLDEATNTNNLIRERSSASENSSNDSSSHNLQPNFNDPVKTTNISHYAGRKVNLIGRDEEFDSLKEFLGCSALFAWFQVSGVAGQGKSRLAYELILYAQNKGWSAGFFETENIFAIEGYNTTKPEKTNVWKSWQPKKPCLFVFDYIIGREDEIKVFFQTLSERTDCKNNVRVLFVERQSWNIGTFEKSSYKKANSENPAESFERGSRAEWFLHLSNSIDGSDLSIMESCYGNGILELSHLNQDRLVEITQKVAKLEEKEITLPNDTIIKQLEHIDDKGRPLYAYFLGQALADNPQANYKRKDQLLDDILKREYIKRWGKIFEETGTPEQNDITLAYCLAVIASICEGLDCKQASDVGIIPISSPFVRRLSMAMNDGPINTGKYDPGHFIPKLEPDLLGEWLVLTAFRDHLPIKDIMNVAWCNNRKKVAAFLVRITQDFPDHISTTSILEHEPPEKIFFESLSHVAARIITNLQPVLRHIPKSIVEALSYSIESCEDGYSLYVLGHCYFHGENKNFEKAFECFHRASNLGNSAAMVNLGGCYSEGKGVEQNSQEAVKWYHKAADLGNDLAMTFLGMHYGKGDGVERDLIKSMNYHAQATAASISNLE